MIGVSVRDHKGREVAIGRLYDHDFDVETTPGLALVARRVRLHVTHSGRGPFTWHVGPITGEAIFDGRVKKGDKLNIPTLRILVGGAA